MTYRYIEKKNTILKCNFDYKNIISLEQRNRPKPKLITSNIIYEISIFFLIFEINIESLAEIKTYRNISLATKNRVKTMQLQLAENISLAIK